jgi:translation initiation factor IF-2
VEVSALKKTNLDGLLEALHLQAEILELKANPKRAAEGTVVEAKLDKGRGPLATVLVQRGTLKVGDIFVVGAISGKVRAMIDDKGKQVKEAGPSVPVEVLGLSGVPSAAISSRSSRTRRAPAKSRLTARASRPKRTTSAPDQPREHVRLQDGQAVEYPLVIKADVQGSVEAIVNAVNRISNEDIKVRVLHAGVGGITESDVTLAGASNAPIIGFNVRPNAKAREIAERSRVEFPIL